jgi:hypothetical protein
MTTYNLARAGTSFHPRVQEKGVFSISYPIDGDAALAASYLVSSGDVLNLGWLPKGVSIIDAFGFLAEAGTSSTWTLGYTGSSTGLSPTAQAVNSSTIAKYQFFAKSRPLLIDSSIIPDTTIPGRILLVLTNTAVNSPSVFTGHITVVMTYDYIDSTNPPAPISQPL